MNDKGEDEGFFEPDDIRSLYEDEHPGGWAAHRHEQEEQERLEMELQTRSPWRRLEKRIEQMAYDAGIETQVARKFVEDRLAVEIAEVVVQEFRKEVGLGAGRGQKDGFDPGGVPSYVKAEEPRVVTPYMNVEQAAFYLKKTTKAVYGLIERGRLRKMPGSRICYFTKEMLDEFLRGETANGRGVRPSRRKKN